MDELLIKNRKTGEEICFLETNDVQELKNQYLLLEKNGLSNTHWANKIRDKIKKLKGRIFPKVSIVLPVYNSMKFIDECLNSILNQTFRDYELIIIDDCSTDGTTEFLEEKKIQYYKNSENFGFAKNLNKGIGLSKGEYIMVVDHDMVYEKDYLETMMSNPKDIMSGKCYYYPSSDIPEKNIVRSMGINVSLITGKTTSYGRDDCDDTNLEEKEVEAGGAGTLVFKREIFDKIRFDEKFYKYYVDLDFCYSAKKRGFRTFLTNANVWHKKQREYTFEKEELKEYYKDKKRFLKKHSPYYPFCIIPIKLKQLII